MTENTVLCHLTQENALEKPGTRYHLFMDAEENPKNCMRVLEELHLDDYSVTDVVLQVFGDSGSSRSLFCYFLDNIPEIQCTLAKPCFWTSGVCRNLKISFYESFLRFYVLVQRGISIHVHSEKLAHHVEKNAENDEKKIAQTFES